MSVHAAAQCHAELDALLGQDADAPASSHEAAVAELFSLLREPVYRYLCSFLSDPSASEDLTQETFIRLLNELRKGQRVEHVRAWIFRVARNLAIDHLRAVDRQPCSIEDIAPEDAPAASNTMDNPARSAFGVREFARWQAALARLSPQEQQCLELRAEGLRYREIGEVLGMRIPSVQTVLARAVKKMRPACE